MVKEKGKLIKVITVERIGLIVAIGLLFATWYQAHIMRQTLHNSGRAYVYYKETMITPGHKRIGEQEPRGRNAVVVTLANSGETPARGVTIKIARCIRSGDLPKDFGFAYPGKQGGGIPPMLIAPKRETQVADNPLSEAFLTDIERGKKSLFVYGEITYADIFDNRHRVQFCDKYMGFILNPEGKMKGYVFGPCDRHNCYDDDCPAQWGNATVGCCSENGCS